MPGQPFWVFYEPPHGDLIAADGAHAELVRLVNGLKEEQGSQPGGSFSINEHGQVIARTAAPPAAKENAVHLIARDLQGNIVTYCTPITFQGGAIDPTATPAEGEPWPGPLCGMTYSFAAQDNPKPPSRNLDEVWMDVEGQNIQLSQHAGIDPYPPPSGTGQLADFLARLRRRFPEGGRFRVNEHCRAFTPEGDAYIGEVPLGQWFKKLTHRS